MEFNGNLAGSSARKLSRLKRALQACRAHQEQSLSVSQAPDIELRDYPLAGVETPATANQTGIWFLCQKPLMCNRETKLLRRRVSLTLPLIGHEFVLPNFQMLIKALSMIKQVLLNEGSLRLH